MKRQKLFIVFAAICSVALVVLYIHFTPSKSITKVKKRKIEEREPVFSSISKEEIDSTIQLLTDEQKLQQLFWVSNDSADFKGGMFLNQQLLPDTNNNLKYFEQPIQILDFNTLYHSSGEKRISQSHLHSMSDTNWLFGEMFREINQLLPKSQIELVLFSWKDSSASQPFVQSNFQKILSFKDSLESKGILTGIHINRDFNFDYLDSLNYYGFPLVCIEDTLMNDFKFKGLKVLKYNHHFDLKYLGHYDAFWLSPDEQKKTLAKIQSELTSGSLNMTNIEKIIKNKVAANIWINNHRNQIQCHQIAAIKNDSTLVDSLKEIEILKLHTDTINSVLKLNQLKPYYERKILSESFVLLRNKRLPLREVNGLTLFAREDKKELRKTMRNWNSCSFKEYVLQDSLSFKNTCIVWIDTLLNNESHQKFIQSVNEMKSAIIINQGYHQNAELIKSKTFIQINGHSPIEQFYLAQAIFGAHKINGKWFYDDEQKGKVLHQDVLGYDEPEGVKMNQDTLRKIRYIINSAIQYRAFPGAQVLVARKGKIVFNQSFGYHTYKKQQTVKNTDLYDIASVTKIVATTLMAMKLYEEGLYQLDDSLWKYLPEDTLKPHLKFPPSTIRNITFRELLTHRSGLPAGMNLIGYMLYTDSLYGRFDKYYCDLKDTVYNIPVAENFYLEEGIHDSLWVALNQIYLDPAKPYKYSDISMNLLYEIFSSILRKNESIFEVPKNKKLKEKFIHFEEFLQQKFYRKLGMDLTVYRPLRFFSAEKIVPTEDESYWRKQLLRGHVHDPYAAMLGGVAGNAGIFTNVTDLAVLMQMWLNKGHYGGNRYLQPETVELFTRRQSIGHRGLGFNKPSGTGGFGIPKETPLSTYGHTGFTGICTWVDPENELVYIFMSNRVHPEVNKRIYQLGVRKNIFNAIYQAMINK